MTYVEVVATYTKCGHHIPHLMIEDSLSDRNLTFESIATKATTQVDGKCSYCNQPADLDDKYSPYVLSQELLSRHGWADFWVPLEQGKLPRHLFQQALVNRVRTLWRLEQMKGKANAGKVYLPSGGDNNNPLPPTASPRLITMLDSMRSLVFELGETPLWSVFDDDGREVRGWLFLWQHCDRPDLWGGDKPRNIDTWWREMLNSERQATQGGRKLWATPWDEMRPATWGL